MTKKGWFGSFGGAFVPETLIEPIRELEAAFEDARRDAKFGAELDRALKEFVGRPTPITFARNLTEKLGGARIFLKREDLAHTGAHKINNALGQALLAKRMGKKRRDRRDGRGPARRGFGHRRGALRASVHGLHGLDRYGTPGAQRRSACVCSAPRWWPWTMADAP